MTTEIRPALRYPGKVDLVDLSSCQDVAGLDLAQTKAAGFEGCIIKGSTGAGSMDPSRLKLLAMARAADMYTMLYLFHIPGVDPAKQVATSIDAEGALHPLRRIIDVESFSKELTSQQYVDQVRREVDLCEQNDGCPPVIYTAPYMGVYLGEALAKAADLARCPLWTAQYMSATDPWVPPIGFTPKKIAPWSGWTMHQYSGNGGYRVPGIPGVDCDRSLYNGDLASFRTEFLGLSANATMGTPTFSLPDFFPDNDTDPDAA